MGWQHSRGPSDGHEPSAQPHLLVAVRGLGRAMVGQGRGLAMARIPSAAAIAAAAIAAAATTTTAAAAARGRFRCGLVNRTAPHLPIVGRWRRLRMEG